LNHPELVYRYPTHLVSHMIDVVREGSNHSELDHYMHCVSIVSSPKECTLVDRT
jgi:hypothetical protein